MVPISINSLRSLSFLLKEATVVKMVAAPPRTDNNPAKEEAEMIKVIVRKIHITLFDVVTMLLAKRATASRHNNAAVQCPNNMKWQEINVADTTKQATIFALSLN